MKVILDELTPKEFFSNGGVIEIVFKSNILKSFYEKNRSKFVFYDYKKYIRFMRELYLRYMTRYSDLKTNEVYQQVNEELKVKCHIGTKEYTIDPKFDKIESLEFCNFYYCGDSDIFELSSRINKKDPYGIRNVNFSRIDTDDSRWKDFEEQRINRGFDDSELWFLDSTIVDFILPRLKAFRENHFSHPMNLTSEQWNEILDDIITAFELYKYDNVSKSEEEKIEKGMKLFINNLTHLFD